MAEGGRSRPRPQSIDPDRPYPMNLPRMGNAVIVNNVTTELPGTMRDVEAMKAAYEKVGFDVQVHLDCNDQKMRKVKKWIMTDDNHGDCNCFALVIITHGNEKGSLLDSNKKRAWDTEMFVGDLSDVETLTGKPKILTIQACRGRQWSEGRAAPTNTLPEEEDIAPAHMLPDKADMFITYSTVPGYRAHGGDDKGSIYLQSYAEFLSTEYMRRPLDKILKMVRQKMVRQTHGSSGMKICSEERNSLIYDVMFSEFHKLSVSEREHANETSGRQDEPLPKKCEPSEREHSNQTSGKQEIAEHERLPKKDELSVHDGEDSDSEQLPEEDVAVSLDLLSTHDTTMCLWGRTRMCTGPTPGTMVTFGKTSEEEPPTFMIYDVKGKTVRIRKTIKHTLLCEHKDDVFILPVSIQGKDLLAVSCPYCKTIRLLDTASEEVTEAFCDERFYPGAMCQGKQGQIYCVNAVEDEELILVLDCTQPQFSFKQTLPISFNGYHGLTYDPVNDIIVLSDAHGDLVTGYSVSTGNSMWEREVSGNGMKPWGLVYFQKQKVVIVCEQRAIVVLNPTDGSVVKEIEQVNKDHWFVNVCICDDTVVVLVLDRVTDKWKLYLYSLT